MEVDFPQGITTQIRMDGKREYIFILEFNRESICIELGFTKYRDLLKGQILSAFF